MPRESSTESSSRSPPIERFGKETKEARVLITDYKTNVGNANVVDKPTRTLSRAVGRVEEERMSSLISISRREAESRLLLHMTRLRFVIYL